MSRRIGSLERITNAFGSVPGLLTQFTIEIAWVLILGFGLRIDRYPFQFMTLVLSLQAITLSQMVMLVQRRQGVTMDESASDDRHKHAADWVIDSETLHLLHEVATRLGINRNDQESEPSDQGSFDAEIDQALSDDEQPGK